MCGLALGHHGNELFLRQWCKRVVRCALIADGRRRLGQEVLSVRRPGAVRGEYPGLVGEREELLVGRVVEHSAEFLARDASGRKQIRSADISDEQRVASEHPVGGLRPVANDDADRFGGVARRVEDLELDVAQCDAFAVRQLDGGPCSAADSR